MSSVSSHSVRVGEADIAYLEAGPESGPVAIFVHGVPAGSELWREVIANVAGQGWRCLAPDLPGYGCTTLPEGGDYSVRGAADLLMEWVRQENFGDIWLVGHDIGGGVAQLMLTADSSRFRQVTLSNCITADTWPIPSIFRLIIAARIGLFAKLAASGVFRSPFGKRALYGAVANRSCLTKERLDRIFWNGKVRTREGRKKFQAMLASLDPLHTIENMPALREVKLPVHLIWGLMDPNQPWEGPGKILRETFPDARITELPGAGHFLQIDAPVAYLSALLEGAPAAE